jgi:hypothetical protein
VLRLRPKYRRRNRLLIHGKRISNSLLIPVLIIGIINSSRNGINKNDRDPLRQRTRHHPLRVNHHSIMVVVSMN